MIYTTMKTQIKEAMKSKDNISRDVLKMVIDKARTIQKEQNPNNVPETIPDDIMMQAVQKEMKQLAQTKDALKGRELCDLYNETTHKIVLLSAYLPSQMTKEEVEKAVADILSDGEYLNFGMKMKVVMNELRGKADNKLIKEAVETYK